MVGTCNLDIALVNLVVAMIKYLEEANLREDGFILDHHFEGI